MTPLELLANLEARGVRLTARADRLVYDAPAGVMTAELLGLLRANRAELLAALTARPQPEPPAVGQLESHADREIRRFWSVARPRPDGRGWYDPAHSADLEALARVAEPPPAPRVAATLPDCNNQLTINPK